MAGVHVAQFWNVFSPYLRSIRFSLVLYGHSHYLEWFSFAFLHVTFHAVQILTGIDQLAYTTS